MLYRVESEEVSFAKRATRTAIVFAVIFLGGLLIHRLWFAKSPLELGERFFDAVLATGTFLVFDSQRRQYEIEVTDETISMRGGLSLGNRTVRRGRIHFLHERRGNIFREHALWISEHGAIHSFLFGCVWIPATMPQYEEIKNKAMSWMEIG